MYSALRPYFNTGVALAGATAVALAPVVITPSSVAPFEHAVSRDVALAASVDLSGALNALGNSVLLGVAVSLDLDPALVTALQAAVTTGAGTFFDNLGGVGGAIVDTISTAFATNPLDALAYLATLPVSLLTGAAGGLFQGLTGVLGALPGLPGLPDLPGLPGLPGLGDVTGLLATPVQFILNALEAGNVTLAGLLSTGVTGSLGLITSGLQAATGLLTGGLVTGAGLLGGLFDGGAGVLTTGAATFAAALAPLAALPLAGVPVAALGDVLGGLAVAGSSVLNGVGTAIPTGATIISNLINSTVGALGTAINGGAGLLAAGVSGVSLATYQALSGLAAGIGDFVPGVVSPTPAPPAPVAAIAGQRALAGASVATGDVASPPSLKRSALTAQAAAQDSGGTTPEKSTAEAVKDRIHTTDPGPQRGTDVSATASNGASGGAASNTNPASGHKPDNTGKPDKASKAGASSDAATGAGRGAAGSKAKAASGA